MALSRDWRGELRRQSAEVRAAAGSARDPGIAERACDLARALEAAEPDRVHAVEMYLVAWKSDHGQSQALRRARELCLELGQLATAAKIARLLYQETKDASYLAVEGMCWLDADQPDQAVRALMTAARAMPDDRLVTSALSIARQEWPDVRGEVARLRAESERARTADAAADLLVQAARIVRMLGTEEQEYGELLEEAVTASPTNEAAFSLRENWLIGRKARDELMAAYELRADVQPEKALEVMRRAGTRLVLSKTHVGLGIRLLTRCLETAYAGDEEIPGHLAMLAVLRQYAEPAKAEAQFLSLLARGLDRSLPAEEEAALAVLGIEVGWGRLKNAGVAYPYATVLGGLADQHPSLRAYYNEGGMAMGATIAQTLREENEGDEEQEEDDDVMFLDEVEEIEEFEEIEEDDLPSDQPIGPVPESAIDAMRAEPARPTRVERRPFDQSTRRAPRLAAPVDLRITLPTGGRFSAVTRDVSETGVMFLSQERLPLGSHVELRIELGGAGQWQVTEFSLTGRVVRAGLAGVSVDFDACPEPFRQQLQALLSNQE